MGRYMVPDKTISAMRLGTAIRPLKMSDNPHTCSMGPKLPTNTAAR